jgi:hypothetical protein
MRPAALIVSLAVAACSPAAVTRIGPPLAPRQNDCAVEVLEDGSAPTRPYRDVGMVTLQNCQDPLTLPCRRWLEEAVCGLGGTVAYLPEHQRPRADLPAPMTFAVMAAVYVADLFPSAETDAVLGSRAGEQDCEEDAGLREEPAGKCVE